MVGKRKAVATTTSAPRPKGAQRLRGRPRQKLGGAEQRGGVKTTHLPNMAAKSSSSVGCWWGAVGGLFDSEVAKDMTIIIENDRSSQRFECHKNFLQIRTKELKNLVSDEKNGLVFLPTVEPKAFGHLFSFLYKDTFEDRKDLTEEDLINVLKLGNRYCPLEEVKICHKLMDGKITLKNVFRLHARSKCYRLSALEEMTQKYINNVNNNAAHFIATHDFLEMEEFCLSQMLKSDELICPEITLFQAVVKWGESQQNELTLRAKLENVIHDIRFPLLHIEDIEEIVEPLGVLTSGEMQSLKDYVNYVDIHNLSTFTTRPRAYLPEAHHGKLQLVRDDTEDLEEFQVKFECTSPHPPPEAFETSNNFQPGEQLKDTDQSTAVEKYNPSESESLDVSGKTWKQFVDEVAMLDPNQNIKNIIGVMNFGEFEPSELLFLPHLEKVSLNVNEVASNSVWLEMPFPSVRKFLFFKKFDEDKDFDALFSSRSNVEIQLSIDGAKCVKLSRLEGELAVSGLFYYPFKEQLDVILEEGCIKTLILGGISPIMPSSPWHLIKELVLWEVYFRSTPKLGQFLLEIPNLQNLTSWVHVQETDKWGDTIQEQPACLDLVDHLPRLKKLTKIAVCCCEWISPPSTNMETIIMENVVELYSDRCIWRPGIFAHFHTIFPNLEKLAVCGYESFEDDQLAKWPRISTHVTSSVTIQAMINILKIESIKWIQIAEFDWTENSTNDNHKEVLMEFFCKAELKPSSSGSMPKGFILEKNSETGVWTGTALIGRDVESINHSYSRQLDMFMYEDFQLNRIFRTFEAFRNQNQNVLHH